ncbi:hypothetical protein [Metabacillus fastidiosus]|uniref:Swarming motility protein SwrB n=1 Tax=Metabacillus fastidiosus TaxID=1458 RepID=A0ABU6NWL2_9BACI|nr:hypothetical protein [Metabacillus fastidiosus]MED4401505.1 Swarming motility protein SwrB [Metabacillus fastidiosus]MED4463139.1 Swarming motility protein SwrB [Metabacillus fastidiosus]
MTPILLVLSLILHVITFYFLILLSTKYSSMKEIASNQERLFEETEQALSTYLIEIKEENEKLIKELKNGKEAFVKRSEPIREAINERKHESAAEAELTEDELPPHLQQLIIQNDRLEISKDSAALEKKIVPLSFEAEVIELYENGHTVEQIAKKFKKGKTEIELLLKFKQK